VAKRKKSHYFSSLELSPGRPARSLVSILTELPGSSPHYLSYNSIRDYRVHELGRMKQDTPLLKYSTLLPISPDADLPLVTSLSFIYVHF
jgi:hypothetical protein